jgi:hypothetical protein
LAVADGAPDEVLYRPAVVKAIAWLPRWWLCDLAKASMWLDARWGTGYWEDMATPGGPCDACGRRAAIHFCGGLEPDQERIGDFLEDHPVQVCGWCHLGDPLTTDSDVRRELALARARSVAWRWGLPSLHA